LFRNEQGGAPRYAVGIPDTQAPLAIGMTYGSQAAQQSAEERQRRADEEALRLMGQPPSLTAPAAQGTSQVPPVSALPARNAQNVTASEDAAFLKSLQPSTADEDEAFLKGLPQPRSTGGRAAYKSGGAVNDIEPLVRNLMNRAQQAKKMTNKDTEALLNSHDDAIASALEVAQKAI
ncbi:MAG: hypothetical protein EBS87_12275, partial [Sphingomonadaceae bacterium]|nr:hypothetical protein [Sphingomonadaceae bacterium]